ncbi:hypothetical protein COF68_05305 [Bacillus toyonensis]|uniref:hypothetical protein n=1 Tax=Bacillus toyonensis TaxID=155322 RepID=UPI000BFC74EC|nr:hypothetical protein [Bacillus toyonensis]PHE64260.1 hypothetical protein COF68_05305 [Bacillus toyonensis]
MKETYLLKARPIVSPKANSIIAGKTKTTSNINRLFATEEDRQEYKDLLSNLGYTETEENV